MIKNRRLRVGLELDGKTSFFEGLKIAASGKKFASPYKNEAAIAIAGLSQGTRNALLQGFSEKKPMRVILEAGREGEGLFTLFVGDIIDITIGDAPDYEMDIRAQTRRNAATKIVSTDGAESVKLRSIAEECALNLGLTLDFQARDRDVAGYSYTGDAAAQVYDIQRAGDVVTYIDDGTLFVLDADTAAKGRRRILNAGSGMIGLPRPAERGVEVTFLIDGPSLLGGQITVESVVNPVLSGDYIIKQLEFNAHTHSDEFYYIAKGERFASIRVGKKDVPSVTGREGDKHGGYL